MGELDNNNQKSVKQGGNTPPVFSPPKTEVDFSEVSKKVVSARPIEGVKMHLPESKKRNLNNISVKQKVSFLNKLKNKLLFKKSEEIKEREAKEVEFIPEDLISPLKLIKELKLPIIMISLTIILMILTYSSLTAYKLKLTNVIKQIDEESKVMDIQISNYKKMIKEVETFQESVKLAKTKLDTHIYWTKFFQLLEKYTLKNVNFLGFSGDNTGLFVLPLITDSYDSLAKQLVAFKNADDMVKEVSITSGGIELAAREEGKTFITSSVTLEVIPEVFIIQNEQED